MHAGHAWTFYQAFSRSRLAGGALIFRMEDLDRARCRPEYAYRALTELRELGIFWEEGPDVGGAYGPYRQSERIPIYLKFWKVLHKTGLIYPCHLSRKDVEGALQAPHNSEQEAIFPLSLRPQTGSGQQATEPGAVNWRFAAPYGKMVGFEDLHFGPQSYLCGQDLGDFLIWRKDGFPSYELAVVVDDVLMAITEVVRGRDLLRSTARQLLLYQALGHQPPAFYHTDLIQDPDGNRLSKRGGSTALSTFLAGEKRFKLQQWLKSGDPAGFHQLLA